MDRQPALADLLPEPPELPHAERAAREVLCLPMFAELTDAEVDRVGGLLPNYDAGALTEASADAAVESDAETCVLPAPHCCGGLPIGCPPCPSASKPGCA